MSQQGQFQPRRPIAPARSLPEPEFNLGNLPKINESEIGNGVDGNLDTIQVMKKIARERAGDPLVRKLALNILHQYQIPSNHYVDECLAIGDYVKRKVRYVKDPSNIEYLQDPVDLIKQIQAGTAQGDCDDQALLTAALLLSVGHDPKFRAVRYETVVGNYNHIYVVVYERNPYKEIQRVVLDCILKDKQIGTEVPHASGDEFEV